MYNFLFYSIYRTSSTRKEYPLLDASIYVSMLFIGHIITCVMLFDIVLYRRFRISIEGPIRDHGKWVVISLSMVGLFFIYRYYAIHIDSIVQKYQARYSNDSHWKWFLFAIAVLLINSLLMLGLVDHAVSQHR